MPNYIASKTDVAPDVQMGENNIIFQMSHAGLHGIMGNNNLIRQNVYLGHNFKIADGNIFSPGTNIGGLCSFGSRCYVGIGATLTDNLIIADETLIGAGSVVIKSTEPHTKYIGVPAKPAGEHKENGIEIKRI